MLEKVAATGAARKSLVASILQWGDGENERMMANRKLGVVGNQMAGVGGVEEMRSPGGERFGIMMFGAEPHGN